MDPKELFSYIGNLYVSANKLREQLDSLAQELEETKLNLDKANQQEKLLQNVVKQLNEEREKITSELNNLKGAGASQNAITVEAGPSS